MRVSTLTLLSAVIGIVVSLAGALGFAQAAGRTHRANTIAVEDIKPGMKGYGLTVFEGTRPEKFDVEVIDVLQNFRPRQPLILVKTHHPRLEIAKVVAGMSGSPIYLDGKMAGAYAYGWTFGKEPVAGVTPIANMIEDLERPVPKFIHGWNPFAPEGKRAAPIARAAPPSGARYSGSLGDYDVFAHARQVAEQKKQDGLLAGGPLAAVSTPLLVGGMTGRAVETARELLTPLGLEPLQAGGGGATEASAPTRFVDGGAIGVQMIRGDINATGLGTVTRVEGDKLVAFGHPMMEAGVTALPTAIGRVLWFLASEFRSFKIGMPVRPLGALINDRQASIVVSHSAKAPTIPVRLKIRGVPGAPHTNWQFELAHEKFMAPTFLSVALGNALQSTAADRLDVSWNAVSRLRVHGHGELELKDFGVAVGGTPDPREMAQTELVQAVGALLNNPWEPLIVESISMEIELRYAREVLRLRGAEILEPTVEAGQDARVRLTLLPYAGRPITRVVRIPMPKHLAGQTLTLSIRPGYTVDKEQADPENLADLVGSFEDSVYPPKSVIVSYHHGGAVSYRGHVARNLPPGGFDSIRPESATVAPEPFRSETRLVASLPGFMTGQDTLTVEVKPVLR